MPPGVEISGVHAVHGSGDIKLYACQILVKEFASSVSRFSAARVDVLGGGRPDSCVGVCDGNARLGCTESVSEPCGSFPMLLHICLPLGEVIRVRSKQNTFEVPRCAIKDKSP